MRISQRYVCIVILPVFEEQEENCLAGKGTLTFSIMNFLMHFPLQKGRFSQGGILLPQSARQLQVSKYVSLVV
jgi:hypothetical protein